MLGVVLGACSGCRSLTLIRFDLWLTTDEKQRLKELERDNFDDCVDANEILEVGCSFRSGRSSTANQRGDLG